ncbi:MAG: 3-dehydroquinate synthase [Acidimicrobiia bacterium]
MERVSIATTEVLVGRGIPVPVLPVREQRRRVAVLTQPAATPRALEIASLARAQEVECEVIGLPDRDEAKTLAVAASVYEALARFGLARPDTVIGVGGGSATDLAGFVAGTWLRGVEAAHFPTTLLGAVDAAIGGKTGVNLAGKNLVGVIWHPTRVSIDIELLEALPVPLLREGMAEALKIGLVGDPGLCRILVEEGLGADLEALVLRSVRAKAAIVDQDERERGVRAYLNFGHTIGHAIEFASALSHGESVAVGMVAAAEVSRHVLGFRRSDLVRHALGSMELPTHVDGLDSARVRDLLSHDKKRDERGMRMVLLRDLGSPVIRNVRPEEMEIGLASVGL